MSATVTPWAVVAAAQTGDPAALTALYGTHQRRLVAFLRSRGCGPELAEDLAHDVWVRALRHLPGVEDRGVDIGAWLVTIARNVLADHHKAREQSRRGSPPRDAPEPAVDTIAALHEHADRVARSRAVAAHVAQLVPTQRAVLAARYRDELDWAAVAARTGGTVAGVKAHDVRARRRLRQRLDPTGVTA